jgi:hypothetical protein
MSPSVPLRPWEGAASAAPPSDSLLRLLLPALPFFIHVAPPAFTSHFSVWRVGEDPAPTPAPAAPAPTAPSRPARSSPPPPSFRDLMRLDFAMDDDAAPSPHVAQQPKQQSLADVDIDALSSAPAAAATAAASQGERLLKQMQERACSGEGQNVGARVLMTKVVPVAKQVCLLPSRAIVSR